MKAGSTVRLPPGFRSKFLDALTPTEIKTVLAAAIEEPISPRQLLQRQGELAHRLCLPLTGLVAAYRLVDEGSKLFLRWGLPGDIFGLSTLLAEPSTYLVTVEAVHQGSLLTWDLAASRMLIGQFPNMLRAVNSLAARYMDDFIDVLAVRVSLTAPQRLAQMLVKSARQIGRVGDDGIMLDLTNEQLALIAQVSPFTASRQLNKWQVRGIVRKNRGTILLRSLPRLENIAKLGSHRP
ncbi:MAG TPA: Crp/Fnr family transcriptional regulator [Terriglobales bacterium]|jgi:CRP-like cAMP-binding protein|nr:Crp/Fnr family transcriptional regulator [Terriglobales bacterium]